MQQEICIFSWMSEKVFYLISLSVWGIQEVEEAPTQSDTLVPQWEDDLHN